MTPSPVVPKPEPQPTPPPANSKLWCVPLSFGEWLSKLVGKQSVCVQLGWDKGSGLWPF
ncbi:hypothetical protein [Streptomyces xanthophaeus]|uniref:hypothetical protein n=1 Tax=Streptomyces xanthophaeus TaxID=67385 RepID=UPI000AF59210|nr:hypothetical protein [Streptomyces xanthophaeus]